MRFLVSRSSRRTRRARYRAGRFNRGGAGGRVLPLGSCAWQAGGLWLSAICVQVHLAGARVRSVVRVLQA